MYANIAFVHCRVAPWWGLEVLEDLIQNEDFGQAKLFCIFSDRKFLQIGSRKIRIVTAVPAILNKLIIFVQKNNIILLNKLLDYRNMMPIFPFLVSLMSRKLSKYKYDRIVVSSFSVSKNVKFDNSKPNMIYMHCPMQYIWDNYEDYKKKFFWPKLRLYMLVSFYLRIRDRQRNKFDQVIANSQYTKDRTQAIYKTKCEISVQYPRISQEFLNYKIPDKHKTWDYYIFVWRVANLIREVNLIIKLFNHTGDKLMMVGSGPDENHAKKIANKNIIFCGWIDDKEELIWLISKSRWLINLAKESFGINTMQAILLGVPVFGINEWWTAELVESWCGTLVKNKSWGQILSRFEHFKKTKRDRKYIHDLARKIYESGR